MAVTLISGSWADVEPPPLGDFVHDGYLYSIEGLSIAVCPLALPATLAVRFPVGVNVRDIVFRRIGAKSYAYVVTHPMARCLDITVPAAPRELLLWSLVPTAGFAFLGLAFDGTHAWTVESRGTTTQERRVVRYSLADPTRPTYAGHAVLPATSSDRGGAIEMLGNVGGRRLAAVVASGERTHVVDVTGPPFVVSSSLPYAQALAWRGGHLALHEGDDPNTGGDISRWGVYGGLGTAAPVRVAALEGPGYWYDQTPVLRGFAREGVRYLLSGWTNGGEEEWVSVLRLSTSGEIAVVAQLAMPWQIGAKRIDIIGTTAYVWGYPPHGAGGWRYYLVRIDVRTPSAARVVDARELHP